MKVGRQQGSGMRCFIFDVISSLYSLLIIDKWVVQRPSAMGPPRLTTNHFTHPLAQSKEPHQEGGPSYY